MNGSLFDIEQNLMLLEVYSYIKLDKKASKPKDSLKNCNIQSLYDKKDLRDYLHDIPALENFFTK